MTDSDYDNEWDDSTYAFMPEVCSAIITAKTLLWKIAASDLADTAKERICVGKMFQVLQDLPAVRRNEELRILLSGPTRLYGSHQINHAWTIELLEDGTLRIDAGGYFSRPESGGDSFTTYIWEIGPGCEPEEHDLSQAHQIVDDADTFVNEVCKIDINEGGYSLEVDSLSLDEWEDDGHGQVGQGLSEVAGETGTF